MNEFLSAIPFSLLLVVSTGPVFFVIIETSISKGVRRALCVDLGAIIADIFFILIALLGAKTLHNSLESNPQWYLLGGIVLFAFGTVSFFLTRGHKHKIVFESEQLARGSYFSFIAKGFLLNAINIGVFLFWLGLVVVFGAKYQMNDTSLIAFFGYILLIYLMLDLFKIYLAKQLKNILTPRIIYKLKQFVHLILIVFGLFFVFQGVFPEQKQKLESRIEERLK